MNLPVGASSIALVTTGNWFRQSSNKLKQLARHCDHSPKVPVGDDTGAAIASLLMTALCCSGGKELLCQAGAD